MTLKRVDKIINGEYFVDFNTYTCDRCDEDIQECDPHHKINGGHFHPECAYLGGLITHDQCKESAFYWVQGDFHLRISAGSVLPISGKYVEKKPNERATYEYRQWRTAVFARDDYSCRKCGTRGGILNAHHIKSFKDNEELRTVVDNGLTLCLVCHRLMHSGSNK